jgi:Reverse transcriptase (RNA-dependent DNA polymerase)
MGAILWNIMYDAVLRLRLPPGVEIVGFADDIVLVVLVDSVEQVEVRTTCAIGTVVDWMSENKLKVAHNKTEMVLVSNLKQPQTARIELEGCLTISKRQVKYLGVMIE